MNQTTFMTNVTHSECGNICVFGAYSLLILLVYWIYQCMSSSNKEKKLLSKYWYNMANFQKYDNLTNEYSSYIKDLNNDLKKLEASNRKGTLRGKNPSDYATEQDILEMKHNINNAVIDINKE